MRALAILAHNSASAFVNLPLPKRNGGILSETPFGSNLNMVNPLSARIRSPGVKWNRNSECSTMATSEVDPG